jgi:hypothetical protein
MGPGAGSINILHMYLFLYYNKKALQANIKTRVEVNGCGKHCSLLQFGIYYGCKML